MGINCVRLSLLAGTETLLCKMEQKASIRIPAKIGGLPCMTGSEQYRRFAQECLELARSATDDRTRAILSQMAQVWFRLAGEKESSGTDGKSD